ARDYNQSMASVNKVILVGRLGKDPEIRSTPSGTTVAKFSLATDDRYTDKNGEKQERTEWHNITAWGKLAEICGQYLRKGKLIYIEGSIRTDSWDDKETGQKRYAPRSSRIRCRCSIARATKTALRAAALTPGPAKAARRQQLRSKKTTKFRSSVF